MTPQLSDPTNGNPRGDGFGPRALYGFHHGLDIGFWSANPDYRVYVSAPGRVLEVGWSSLVGWYVVVDLGDGWTNRYCHFASKPKVAVGQLLKRREFLGTMGSTGSQASGTHLHFELAKNGTRTDPAPYFTSTAGGGTEITPERRKSMTTNYVDISTYKTGKAVAGTLCATAGDSPGTPANWIEYPRTMSSGERAVLMTAAHGPHIELTHEEFIAFRERYLSPLAIAGGNSSPGEPQEPTTWRIEATATAIPA